MPKRGPWRQRRLRQRRRHRVPAITRRLDVGRTVEDRAVGRLARRPPGCRARQPSRCQPHRRPPASSHRASVPCEHGSEDGTVYFSVVTPPDDVTRQQTDDVLDAALEPRVGSYRLVRELGQGGMGTVYLAVRDDDAFHKRVALKILKRGMDTDSIVRRFRTERQILAGLDHPNIARLLHGGTTPDGRPYLVMEYVNGAPLVEFAE